MVIDGVDGGVLGKAYEEALGRRKACIVAYTPLAFKPVRVGFIWDSSTSHY